MKPFDFFRQVTSPNIQQALLNFDDYRLAVNAILTIDATYGVLFDYLRQNGHQFLTQVKARNNKQAVDDSDFKEHFAQRDQQFAILRDAAYATKHGRLTGSKARLVVAATNIALGGVGCGSMICGHDPLGGDAVFIQIGNQNLVRAEFLIEDVGRSTQDLLQQLNA
ncbi:hypothetical protein ELI24_39065 [Rhizobium ruizarguesonis]|uniref:hypothetical protein n=1 Tax=Rhizobium ruizarguesonis TaxID=2081791 RepID=UPI00103152F4|nr:hypothetical protein [Rhizobium ruizarguesonis]TAV82959.1 hypothetical protein ELI24_39065 [Rhizobium ruizarguesonis]